MQTSQRQSRPPVGEPCAADTPAFEHPMHALNHLRLRAIGTARQAWETHDLVPRLTCATAAYTLCDVVARMAEPGTECRVEMLGLRDAMCELIAATMTALGAPLD
jgi:hypothetical protein